MDDVPEDERKAVARQVADTVIAKLREQGALTATAAWSVEAILCNVCRLLSVGNDAVDAFWRGNANAKGKL